MHTSAGLRAFAERIVDFAGMFPPSQLPLEDAVLAFVVHRRGRDGDLLGRLIVPAARLCDVDRDAEHLTVEPPYSLAAIGRGGDDAEAFLAGTRADLDDIAAFRRRFRGNANVGCLEVKPPAAWLAAPDTGAARELADRVARMVDEIAPSPLQPFYEIPPDERFSATLTAFVAGLAAHRAQPRPATSTHHATYVGAGIKLRCGGTAPPPSSETVAEAIDVCRRADVPLKFTAGLHHAIREPGRSGYPHGFVNLFAAGVLARVHDFDQARLLEVINDESPDHFAFDDEGMSWTTYRASLDEIRAGREYVTAFGSCSFDDPCTDMRAHGWLK